jgi:Gram-negative bacterial TonB protein C-terminal
LPNIGTDGAVRQLDYFSAPKVFLEAARNAVQQWRYRATFLNGEPVEVETSIPSYFKLD